MDDRELERIRDWRHNVATPAIVSYGHRIKLLEDELRETAQLLAETSRTVELMRHEDEFARRLAVELRKRRWAALSTVERAVIVLFASVPLLTLALELAGRIGGH